MKKAAILLLCFVSVTISCFSQTKQESIKELFHLMGKDSLIERTISSMLPTAINVYQQYGQTFNESSKDSLIHRLQMYKTIADKLQNEEMGLYDKYFSQDEIDDLLVFYKSPSGKKHSELIPKIQHDLQLIIQEKYKTEIVDMVISMKNQKMKH